MDWNQVVTPAEELTKLKGAISPLQMYWLLLSVPGVITGSTTI